VNESNVTFRVVLVKGNPVPYEVIYSGTIGADGVIRGVVKVAARSTAGSAFVAVRESSPKSK
jgi:hypothetical protein